MSRTLEEIEKGLANVLCLLAPNERITILAALAEAREGALREVKRLREEFERNGLRECPTCGAFGKHGKPCGGLG